MSRRIDVDEDWHDVFPETEPVANAKLIDNRKPRELQACAWQCCPDCGGPPRCLATNSDWSLISQMLHCETCDGVGYLDVPLDAETMARTAPGSESRVAILAARYRQGLELFPQPVSLRQHYADVSIDNRAVFSVPDPYSHEVRHARDTAHAS